MKIKTEPHYIRQYLPSGDYNLISNSKCNFLNHEIVRRFKRDRKRVDVRFFEIVGIEVCSRLNLEAMPLKEEKKSCAKRKEEQSTFSGFCVCGHDAIIHCGDDCVGSESRHVRCKCSGLISLLDDLSREYYEFCSIFLEPTKYKNNYAISIRS